MSFPVGKSPRYRAIGLTAVLALLIVIASVGLSSCVPSTPAGTQISLSEAIALSKTDNIKSAIVDTGSGTMSMTAAVSGSSLDITDVSGNSVKIVDGAPMYANIDSLTVADLQQIGFVLPAEFSTNAAGSSQIGTILSIVIPLLLVGAVLYFVMRAGRTAQSQAFSFAKSRAKLLTKKMPSVSFSDVAGAQEAKEDLKEVVEFLKDRRKFQSMGAKIPKGVLLVGPPGTGKTLLARAVAGEAEVPFFSVSGSEFVEMFVGVGAARVRDLFEQAKSNAPCIIFIDEIDAVGRLRAGGVPGSHEEREQTLNQILTEMDGFDPNIGVIVLAATNRVDVLDPALLRPGRFDRRVTLDLPDTNGRTEILKLHSKDKPIDSSVDMSVIAKETHGFSGADLADVINEAAILAVRRNKKVIELPELEDAIDRIVAGPERKSIIIPPKDKERTAYHEAGHALVAFKLPNVDPVHKISIVARGSMGGYTRLLTEDRHFITASQFKDTLATLVAGHSSEEIVFHEVSTGPHSDIKQATALARSMVTDYGMSAKLGLRTFGHEMAPAYLGMGPPKERDYSESVAKLIDDEVAAIIEEAHQRAGQILRENLPRLGHIAEKLIDKETLEGPELQAAFTEPVEGTTQPASMQASTLMSPGTPKIL
jgi:cell division protease FtsH